SITLAILAQDRATLQIETFEEWIDAGLLSEEESAKRWTQASAAVSPVAAPFHTAQAGASLLGGENLLPRFGSAAGALAGASSSLASASSAMASLRQTGAGC